MLKFSAGLLILFIVLVLQAWLASAGIFFNLSLAAVIVFAFLFGFWELVALTLLTVFLLNWQPAASVELIVFALLPIAAYLFRNTVSWQPFLALMVAVAAGFAVFYGILSPHMFSAHPGAIVLDIVIGWIMGALIFIPFHRWDA